jgi:electron transport complex protein RnfA
VLGVALFQTAREYSFTQALTFATAGGLGFTLALLLMAGLRERLNLANVPNVVQGTALSLMLAGLLSLAFMGFAGLGAGE